MKRIKFYALATALLLCGTGLVTSCSSDDDDSPAQPATEEQKQEQEPEQKQEPESEALKNRNELIRHIENDAKTMAEAFNIESLNIASQAYNQLLALMESDKAFMTNMRVVLSAVAEKKALLNISPVKVGSELAKMGYLLYMTVDNSGFGVRVVFDGKGGCRLLSANDMEFIFPAKIDGIGSTLFKLIIKDDSDYYLSVSNANIQNMKGLACINRLPRSLYLTLTGFIDNKEVTLSESVINLELPQNASSEFVDFDAKAFQLTGKQHFYPIAGNESTLDFSLNMNKDDMTLGYSYSCNETTVVSCEVQLQKNQQNGYISQMLEDAFDIDDIKALSIRILNDLKLSGTITDGATFAQGFIAAIQNREQVSSPDVLTGIAEALNQSCSLQLSCEEVTGSEVVKLSVVEKDKLYTIEPALKDLTSDNFIPISQIVDAQTMENFNKPFSQSFTPGGNTTGSALKIYSALVQMMPLISAE